MPRDGLFFNKNARKSLYILRDRLKIDHYSEWGRVSYSNVFAVSNFNLNPCMFFFSEGAIGDCSSVLHIDWLHMYFADDSFVTPPSTPPEEDEEFMSITESTDALVKEMSRETLIDIMYER